MQHAMLLEFLPDPTILTLPTMEEGIPTLQSRDLNRSVQFLKKK